jgi:hypothetical protein
MDLSKYDATMEEYLKAISITATQADQIEDAVKNVLALTLSTFPDTEVSAQGSFSTDTLTKPLTTKQGGGTAGEFDVDIAIENESWNDAIDALNAVANAVEDDDAFGKLEVDNTKNSCVRVQYPEDKTGVAFHIDLVPTKQQDGKRVVPDRNAKDWKPSDAKQFAEWFNEKASGQPGLRQVAVMLKRLRDLADITDDIKSILILTLVLDNYYATGNIMGDLVSTLDGITMTFANPNNAPRIENPVNRGEDLAVSIQNYEVVRSFFVDTKQALVDALNAEDSKALKEIFGPGFSYEGKPKGNFAAAATAITSPIPAFGGLADAEADD